MSPLMGEAHRVPPRTTDEISKEWDRIAAHRYRQIATGIDSSYEHLLKPFVEQSISAEDASILDVGCGVGLLTGELATSRKQVVGIDPSPRSIDIAKHKSASNVTFKNCSVEDYAKLHPNRRFDAAVANMTLQCMADLSASLDAISRLLRKEGRLIFTLPHPWFWPRYWKYESAPWFEYQSEVFVEAPFRITNEESNVLTTHIHRPLSMYARSLKRTDFVLIDIVELPTDRAELPRFLGGVARKRGLEPRSG